MNINNDINHFSRKIKYLIGVDEVGRGCLAGPVAAAAILFGRRNLKDLNKQFKKLKIKLKDSKKLSQIQREKIFGIIKKFHAPFVVSFSGRKYIDRKNINNAVFSAMKNAIKKIVQKNQALSFKIIIDGHLKIPNLKFHQEAIIRGDEKLFSIACASIMAKVRRDNLMAKIDSKYPGYNFCKNKGYGTKEHIRAIKNIGPCEIHRKSFLKNIV